MLFHTAKGSYVIYIVILCSLRNLKKNVTQCFGSLYNCFVRETISSYNISKSFFHEFMYFLKNYVLHVFPFDAWKKVQNIYFIVN